MKLWQMIQGAESFAGLEDAKEMQGLASLGEAEMLSTGVTHLS